MSKHRLFELLGAPPQWWTVRKARDAPRAVPMPKRQKPGEPRLRDVGMHSTCIIMLNYDHSSGHEGSRRCDCAVSFMSSC